MVCTGTTGGGTTDGACGSSVVEICSGAAIGTGIEVVSGARLCGALDGMTCAGGDDAVVFVSSTTGDGACVCFNAVLVAVLPPP